MIPPQSEEMVIWLYRWAFIILSSDSPFWGHTRRFSSAIFIFIPNWILKGIEKWKVRFSAQVACKLIFLRPLTEWV